MSAAQSAFLFLSPIPDDPAAPAPAPNLGPTPTGWQRTQGGGVQWVPPSAEHLSRLLPQYEIEGLIGRGGMGAVYKGRQTSLDRMVAIKILPPEMDDEDADYTQRFKNEARIMARLDHPAIVHVNDFGRTSEGQFYFVMSFINGTDVAKMIEAQGRLPPAHALAITAHVFPRSLPRLMRSSSSCRPSASPRRLTPSLRR